MGLYHPLYQLQRGALLRQPPRQLRRALPRLPAEGTTLGALGEVDVFLCAFLSGAKKVYRGGPRAKCWFNGI